MQQLKSGDPTPAVFTIIEVHPDRLIELGHRLKQTAMDFARVGESVTVPLTDRILLLFDPLADFQKPFQTYGDVIDTKAPEIETRLQ